MDRRAYQDYIIVAAWEQRTVTQVGLSVLARPLLANGGGTMKTGHHAVLTHEQQAQLQAIAETTDAQIDLSDMPEKTDWSGAERGKLHRPIKQQLTVCPPRLLPAGLPPAGSG